MTARVLPSEEWPRLVGTEVESIIAGLPADTDVVVVEQQGAIVGTWVLLHLAHVECFWIADAHRGRARVATKLLRSMRDLLRRRGLRCPLTASITPEMSAMIQRLGGIKLPGEHFALPLEDAPCLQ